MKISSKTPTAPQARTTRLSQASAPGHAPNIAPGQDDRVADEAHAAHAEAPRAPASAALAQPNSTRAAFGSPVRKTLSHLPLETMMAIAQNSRLTEIRALERIVYGAGLAPQLYEHVSRPFFALCGGLQDSQGLSFSHMLEHGMPRELLAQIPRENFKAIFALLQPLCTDEILAQQFDLFDVKQRAFQALSYLREIAAGSLHPYIKYSDTLEKILNLGLDEIHRQPHAFLTDREQAFKNRVIATLDEAKSELVSAQNLRGDIDLKSAEQAHHRITDLFWNAEADAHSF